MLEQVDRSTERTLRERIDPAEMERHLDAFEGLERTSGSPDEWAASEYVVETLEEYGVDATLHEYEGLVSVPESATVTATTPTRRQLDATTVSFGASTPAHGTHAPVVSAARLDSASRVESGRRDESWGEVEGKLLYATELPSAATVARAERAGAAGVIFRSPNEHLYQGIVTPVWGTPSTDTAEDVPSLPVVEVPRSDGDWLADRLDEGPVEVTVETEVTTELATLPCPVGTIPGSASDRYFLVGNHVDSWFEGMTDNATAMAATLELARVFAERDEPPKRGLAFGFWSAHSTGRYAGSAWYADDNWLDLRKNGVAYLHLDLPGLKGADSVWYQQMAELEDEHRDAIREATHLPAREEAENFLGSTDRPARNSDQSFWGAGLSSLLSGARLAPGTEEGGPIGGGWWWHTPEDTRDKVDLDVLVEETKLYLTLAARVCESPVLPHDFRATVGDVEAALDEIESAAGGESADEGSATASEFSVDGVRSDLAELGDALDRAYEVVEERAGDDPAVAAATEDLQVELGNVLNPALYMEAPEYEHEPRQPHRQLPYLRLAEDLPELTGRERRFAETKLRRGRTKLAHRVRRATAATERFLDSQQ